MRLIDTLNFSASALNRHRLRTTLILLAMGMGVSAIVILTSLGESARRYVTGEFASLGTNMIIVMPGRSETSGGAATLMVGETPRDLTLDDAMALTRNRNVRRVAPIIIGEATASFDGLDRPVPVLGSNSQLQQIRHWELARGRFLPPGDANRSAPVCVIGVNLYRELFRGKPALGQWLRIGERRYRVIGILASEGRSIGIDVQELIIIPAVAAQTLFNSPSLFRILVEAVNREDIPSVMNFVETTLTKRHQGERDVTIITQDAVLSTFDKIFHALTLTVAGIAAISLGVAGILIMNVMLVSVTRRTPEIGLLKALGATQQQIVLLFLTEAAILSLVGASIGVLFGELANWSVGKFYPALPVGAPWWAIVTAIVVALLTGLVFGAMPARQAARLDPVQALAHK